LGLPLAANSYVDFPRRPSNNPPMPRPDTVRRVKSYSAADGYVYQYYFFEGNRAHRDGSPGGEFTYVISADRRSAFPSKSSSRNRPWTLGQSRTAARSQAARSMPSLRCVFFRLSMKVPSRPHRRASRPGKWPSTNPTWKIYSDNWASSPECPSVRNRRFALNQSSGRGVWLGVRGGRASEARAG